MAGFHQQGGGLYRRDGGAADQMARRGLRGKSHPGLKLKQVFARNELFTECARDFAAVASGSSGVQGAWLKLLLTRNLDGRWLPDPMVPNAEATDHAITKWAGSRHEANGLILGSEAPYPKGAGAFVAAARRPGR